MHVDHDLHWLNIRDYGGHYGQESEEGEEGEEDSQEEEEVTRTIPCTGSTPHAASMTMSGGSFR